MAQLAFLPFLLDNKKIFAWAMKHLLFLPVVLLSLSVVFAADSTTPEPQLSAAAFAQKIAMVDLLEIQLGEVAQKNASLDSVKTFGVHMVEGHTEINEMLTKAAIKSGITIPTKLDAPSEATLQKLSALKGAAFDKAYIPAMVAGHTEVLALVKSFAATSTDPGMKKFAQKLTPMIAHHLAMAEKVQAQMTKDGLLP